ncbi:VirB10 type IV secretion protein [Helicobacter fennelliae]|uniref:VirB10 type IV secretion protein n=1 Tax=Helicobacter fennelliae TaxID=215 RepID=A0A2X3GMG1_9HELI|nr:DNA type IV secretion system protein ComB10 [Helicobacter fennelliae]SQC36310.1 VirB10 type IV secretion protein [Helicobacter fennelliae]
MKRIFVLGFVCTSLTLAAVKDNLDYLFETKFPISDYVWNGKALSGKAQASNIGAKQSTIQNKGRKVLTDKYGNPILDENGNPIYIDEEGNLYTKDGKFLGKALVDRAMAISSLIKYGKPIMYDENGKIKGSQDSLLLDKFNNPVFDKQGNPIFVDKNGNLKDAQGKTILDSNGKPINVKDKDALEKFLEENTKNSMAEQLKREQERLQKELQAQQKAALAEEEARKIAQEEARRKAQEESARRAEEEAKRLKDPAYQALLAQREQQRALALQRAKEQQLYKSAVLGERVEGNSQIFAQRSSLYGDSGFSNQQSIDIATNEHRLYRMIRAGRLIPAVLMTPIVSNIEGIITAQVEQDVYAAQGRAVLIPRGTKVMGFYKNDNKIGQSRLSIVWREMITPQGVNILLTNAMSADSRGINGVEGYLDNKFSQRYGLGLFLNTLSNGLMISISNLTQKNGTMTSPYTAQLFSNAQGDINNIFKQLIQEQSKIKPTIEIRAGSRIFITPTTHMWFPIPKNGEVMAQYFSDEYQ